MTYKNKKGPNLHWGPEIVGPLWTISINTYKGGRHSFHSTDVNAKASKETVSSHITANGGWEFSSMFHPSGPCCLYPLHCLLKDGGTERRGGRQLLGIHWWSLYSGIFWMSVPCYVVLARLELVDYLALDSQQSSCLSLSGAGIIGMCHHVWLP